VRTQSLVAISLLVNGLLIPAGIAASADGAHAAAPKSLTQEFDLTPKLLSSARGGGSGDPLKAISTGMTGVHGDLAQLKTDEPVQVKERQVVRKLDELIAALERHCSGLGRGNTPNGGRRDSIIANGSTNFGDLHGVDPNVRQWSQLPPKLRNEILQSKTDGFPPGYEALLQSYYQQLAEEKSLDEKPAAAAAPTPNGKKAAP
jgi:hypothetical protein